MNFDSLFGTGFPVLFASVTLVCYGLRLVKLTVKYHELKKCNCGTWAWVVRDKIQEVPGFKEQRERTCSCVACGSVLERAAYNRPVVRRTLAERLVQFRIGLSYDIRYWPKHLFEKAKALPKAIAGFFRFRRDRPSIP